MSMMMNLWTWATVAWLGIGMLALCWFMYEADGNIRRTVLMRLVELILGPVLWPLAAYNAWIWRKGRLGRSQDFRRTGTPHCPRHGYILLKCEVEHEPFCSGCSGECSVCGRDAWFSPRYHGRSPDGEPVIVYEPIYTERPEWM